MDLTKLTPAPWEASNKNWRNEDAGHDRYIVGNRFEDEDTGDVCATAVAIVKGNATSGTIQDANAEFICLARNAFDVLMRRAHLQWCPVIGDDGLWCIVHSDDAMKDRYADGWCVPGRWPDAFTALVEADQWYAENIEGKGATG